MRIAFGAQFLDVGRALVDRFLGAVEGFHLFEDFGFEFGTMLARGIAFADGGGVLLLVCRGHQRAVGVLGLCARLL